jgi:chromosome segregation ATPase
MTEYQWTMVIVLPVYSAALWMCCRYWYTNPSEKEQPDNPAPVSVSAEESQKGIQGLRTENEELGTKPGQAGETGKRLYEQNTRLEGEIKTLKECNRQLTEALQALKEIGRKPLNPESGVIFDSGTTCDEFEAMVQVMKGRPVTRDVHIQAVQAMRKTEGTVICSQLVDIISGAKERVEEALNEQPNSVVGDSFENSDIMKYIRV